MPAKAATTVARGGVRPHERALAPDLARGLMLLMIVMSNTGFYLWAAPHGPSGWHPVDGTLADRVAQFLMITMLDLRIYPLFAFLFGYGMMQLFLRQTVAGTSERAAVALLRRRSLLLIVFGFVHAALLMAGDIIGSYGVMSLLLGWLFLRRRDRTLLVWSAIAGLVMVVVTVPRIWALVTGDLAQPGVPPTEPATEVYASGEEDLLAAAGTRLTTWVFVTLGGGLLSFGGMSLVLLAFWAARRRILEEPLTLVRDGTGLAGGLGYIAAIALVAHELSVRRRRPRAVVAVAAVGSRSLSCYLTHSLIFSPLLAAWGLGLGAVMESATRAGFACCVWLVTVVGAYALERSGRRGPAEWLLRRLLYGANRATAQCGTPRLTRQRACASARGRW
ncbi:DUF418 domain-containing protein [Actinopolymorpha sp. B17G11]|uniref:DUF418 domain-containing protein n=2 Tax=unclassified Actinopolymorpha TaxID=2627063 RepID=UPI0032E527CA